MGRSSLQSRTINHQKGSHGVPGIYFKYDMSALKVVVSEDREPLVQFLVRLCAVCGGIYVTSGETGSREGPLRHRGASVTH